MRKGGRAPKAKGNRFEAENVDWLEVTGWKAHRHKKKQPEEPDIDYEHPLYHRVECKRIERFSLSQLYDALEGNDVLIIKASRKPPLFIVPRDSRIQLLLEKPETPNPPPEPLDKTPSDVI